MVKKKHIPNTKIFYAWSCAGLLWFFVLSCQSKTKNAQEIVSDPIELHENEGRFDWLLGKWERLNEEEGKATFEAWRKLNSFHYAGFGYTMSKGDTIWQETMVLEKNNELWHLTVSAPEDPEAIVFVVTLLEKESFTCENPNIDFPKKIKYWKSEGGLQASVSSAELEIPFEFRKVNE